MASTPRARTKRRRVFNKRNSHIGVPLDWLDQDNWWTDAVREGYPLYLHVHGVKNHPEDKAYGMSECVYRVWPRHPKGTTVRIAMENGELFWLIDAERP